MAKGWLNVNVAAGAAAVEAVKARYPDITWEGEDIVDGVETLEEMRPIRRELDAARHLAFLEIQQRVSDRVEALGGRIVYASTTTPLIFAEVSSGLVTFVANSPDVLELSVEGKWGL